MSCGITTLCGISTDFSVLFPTQGQVSHALLTRPPLSFKESKLPFGFVRLACVKHAASVHPEPGSNSQIKFESHVWLNYFNKNSILRIEKGPLLLQVSCILFNFQVPRLTTSLRILTAPSVKVLDNCTVWDRFCQGLFSRFLKLFSKPLTAA